ncbi:hypothetical protein [Nocardioides sp. AE5]|uniref:hypothetical protein n=1 Tax=Nocardioides sp. AE5 TaxID=2962573 RepID=UPI002880FA2E|nr:hypothetical protein [Nocardioides sp. AE5]MDT0200344.1 hypothetical protein [Nocardioides sp. AE5]
MEPDPNDPPASPWGAMNVDWAPVQPVPVQPTPAPSGVLELDQGTRLPLDRWWVLGRSPVAPPERTDATPFAVPDAMKSLSKTHLAVGPAPGGAMVVDVHSVNGVRIRRPSGGMVVLVPGVPATAEWGSTVEYGLRTLVVRAP